MRAQTTVCSRPPQHQGVGLKHSATAGQCFWRNTLKASLETRTGAWRGRAKRTTTTAEKKYTWIKGLRDKQQCQAGMPEEQEQWVQRAVRGGTTPWLGVLGLIFLKKNSNDSLSRLRQVEERE